MKRPPSETWINPLVEIRDSPIEGSGKFAIGPLKAGEKVVVFGGAYTSAEGAKQAKSEKKLVMQWDDDLYSVEERGCF